MDKPSILVTLVHHRITIFRSWLAIEHVTHYNAYITVIDISNQHIVTLNYRIPYDMIKIVVFDNLI